MRSKKQALFCFIRIFEHRKDKKLDFHGWREQCLVPEVFAPLFLCLKYNFLRGWIKNSLFMFCTNTKERKKNHTNMYSMVWLNILFSYSVLRPKNVSYVYSILFTLFYLYFKISNLTPSYVCALIKD